MPRSILDFFTRAAPLPPEGVGTAPPLSTPPPPTPSKDRFFRPSNTSALCPSLVTFNVNSLSYYASHSPYLERKRRLADLIEDLSSKHDIVCLQETNLHATESSFLARLSQHRVSFNNLDKNRAGTLILDSPSLLSFYS